MLIAIGAGGGTEQLGAGHNEDMGCLLLGNGGIPTPKQVSRDRQRNAKKRSQHVSSRMHPEILEGGNDDIAAHLLVRLLEMDRLMIRFRAVHHSE